MSVTMAYLQRACMYKEALCFKQVVVDAQVREMNVSVLCRVCPSYAEREITVPALQAAIKLCGRPGDKSAPEAHSDDEMIKTILANPGTSNPFE
jgi:hypothetical protein